MDRASFLRGSGFVDRRPVARRRAELARRRQSASGCRRISLRRGLRPRPHHAPLRTGAFGGRRRCEEEGRRPAPNALFVAASPGLRRGPRRACLRAACDGRRAEPLRTRQVGLESRGRGVFCIFQKLRRRRRVVAARRVAHETLPSLDAAARRRVGPDADVARRVSSGGRLAKGSPIRRLRRRLARRQGVQRPLALGLRRGAVPSQRGGQSGPDHYAPQQVHRGGAAWGHGGGAGGAGCFDERRRRRGAAFRRLCLRWTSTGAPHAFGLSVYARRGAGRGGALLSAGRASEESMLEINLFFEPGSAR
mmetsp:Transcript_25863/g.86949  ORF Transcript_25863/g.86949 Transcript_25863/m.86949 type:complete len:307 (+) Transcript_25863:452-1372(+)